MDRHEDLERLDDPSRLRLFPQTMLDTSILHGVLCELARLNMIREPDTQEERAVLDLLGGRYPEIFETTEPVTHIYRIMERFPEEFGRGPT